MKIYFVGTGNANHIALVLEHPVAPRVDEEVCFDPDGDSEIWNVRHVMHTPFDDEYDVYCVVGPPRMGS